MKTKRILNRTTLLMIASAIVMLAAVPSQALADCNGEPANYRRLIVTYYEVDLVYNPSAATDSRCTLIRTGAGRTFCRIRLRGALYLPLDAERGSKFPAIIVNHGSGAEFEANTRLCEIANYFVPKGYIVFAPFRRGQGDDDAPYPNNPAQLSDKSTGIYIEDMLDDFESGNQIYKHPTNCLTRACYKTEIFEQQAGAEVADYAINYLKNRPDIKGDAGGGYAIALMGNSYGGAVTVLANRLFAGHMAAVAFSPAAQQWADDTCPPDDQTCGTPVQKAMLSAARNATKPAFYLQAKWDYDTRPTIDLAYAHAYGGNDDKHGKRFMASIFEYPKPDIDPSTGELDFQSVHVGFARDTARWGPAVLDFLKRNGVD